MGVLLVFVDAFTVFVHLHNDPAFVMPIDEIDRYRFRHFNNEDTGQYEVCGREQSQFSKLLLYGVPFGIAVDRIVQITNTVVAGWFVLR